MISQERGRAGCNLLVKLCTKHVASVMVDLLGSLISSVLKAMITLESVVASENERLLNNTKSDISDYYSLT